MNLFHYVILTEKNPTFSNLEPIFHPLSFQMHSVITKMKKKKKCKTMSSVLKLQTKFIKETCRPELSGIFLIPKNLIGSTNELLLGCTSITFLQKVKIFFPVLFVCLNVFSLCLLIPIQCFKQEQVYSFKFA